MKAGVLAAEVGGVRSSLGRWGGLLMDKITGRSQSRSPRRLSPGGSNEDGGVSPSRPEPEAELHGPTPTGSGTVSGLCAAGFGPPAKNDEGADGEGGPNPAAKSAVDKMAKAKKRQAAMLKKMKAKQAVFMDKQEPDKAKKGVLSGEQDEDDENAPTCCICRVTVKSSPMCLDIVDKTNSAKQDVAGFLTLLETRGTSPGSALNRMGGCMSLTSCGHIVHMSCLGDYRAQQARDENRDDNSFFFSKDRAEFPCPQCRNLCNGCLPLIEPQLGYEALAQQGFEPRHRMKVPHPHGTPDTTKNIWLPDDEELSFLFENGDDFRDDGGVPSHASETLSSRLDGNAVEKGRPKSKAMLQVFGGRYLDVALHDDAFSGTLSELTVKSMKPHAVVAALHGAAETNRKLRERTRRGVDSTQQGDEDGAGEDLGSGGFGERGVSEETPALNLLRCGFPSLGFAVNWAQHRDFMESRRYGFPIDSSVAAKMTDPNFVPGYISILNEGGGASSSRHQLGGSSAIVPSGDSLSQLNDPVAGAGATGPSDAWASASWFDPDVLETPPVTARNSNNAQQDRAPIITRANHPVFFMLSSWHMSGAFSWPKGEERESATLAAHQLRGFFCAYDVTFPDVVPTREFLSSREDTEVRSGVAASRGGNKKGMEKLKPVVPAYGAPACSLLPDGLPSLSAAERDLSGVGGPRNRPWLDATQIEDGRAVLKGCAGMRPWLQALSPWNCLHAMVEELNLKTTIFPHAIEEERPFLGYMLRAYLGIAGAQIWRDAALIRSHSLEKVDNDAVAAARVDIQKTPTCERFSSKTFRAVYQGPVVPNGFVQRLLRFLDGVYAEFLKDMDEEDERGEQQRKSSIGVRKSSHISALQKIGTVSSLSHWSHFLIARTASGPKQHVDRINAPYGSTSMACL